MKKWLLIYSLLFYIPFIITQEGFAPQTLVVTPRLKPFVVLGSLKQADVIAAPQPGYLTSYSSVRQILRIPVTSFVEITINSNVILQCGVQQLFYSPSHQGWVQAQNLSINDTLLTIANEAVEVTAFQIINQPTTLVAVSCYHPHTFAVTEYAVVAHNMEPVLQFFVPQLIPAASTVATVALPKIITLASSAPAFGTIITYAASTSVAVGTTAYCLYKMAKEFFGFSFSWISSRNSKPMPCGTSLLPSPTEHRPCGNNPPAPVYEGGTCGTGIYGPPEPERRFCGSASYLPDGQPVTSCGTSQLTPQPTSDMTPCLVISPEIDQDIVHACAKNRDHKKPKQTEQEKANRRNPKYPLPIIERKPGPHGLYEDAPYHTAKGNDIKSRRPTDGQTALDNSVPIDKKGNSRRRIGISQGEFVVLAITRPGIYHGHVRDWNELDKYMQDALKEAGLANPSGKIMYEKK